MSDTDLQKALAKLSALTPDQLGEIATAFISPDGGRIIRPARPDLRKPVREEPAVFRIRVDLDHSSPPIWRRLEVRSDVTLLDLHQVLQAAFGWFDAHLYRFALGGDPFDMRSQLFLCQWDFDEGEEDGIVVDDVRLDETLCERGDTLRYDYDYGDSWELTVKLEAVLPVEAGSPVAVCTGGRRAAPPEDCGGLRDADRLAEVVPDPSYFDTDDVNAALRDPFRMLATLGFTVEMSRLLGRLQHTEFGEDVALRLLTLGQPATAPSPAEVAAALSPIQQFLGHVGDDGLTLTSAGYLKPADVEAACEIVPAMADWIGKNNRELQCVPLLEFRLGLQKLALTRKYKGRLLLTKVGAVVRADADRLWTHLVGRLRVVDPTEFTSVRNAFYLLHAATSADGRVDIDDLDRTLTVLGWRAGGTTPVGLREVMWTPGNVAHVLQNVTADPFDRHNRHRLSAVAVELARQALTRG